MLVQNVRRSIQPCGACRHQSRGATRGNQDELGAETKLRNLWCIFRTTLYNVIHSMYTSNSRRTLKGPSRRAVPLRKSHESSPQLAKRLRGCLSLNERALRMTLEVHNVTVQPRHLHGGTRDVSTLSPSRNHSLSPGLAGSAPIHERSGSLTRLAHTVVEPRSRG
jgi:hypothetical protein